MKTSSKSSGLANDPLRNVVLAMDPTVNRRGSFSAYSGIVSKFQKIGAIPSVRVVSMIHQSLFMVPPEWYYQNKDRYAEETRDQLESALKTELRFKAIHVLKGKSSSNRLLINELSAYLKKIHSELLIVFTSNRTGIPYWLLGSFAETAALSASTPVLVIKPHTKGLSFSRTPRFTVALDPQKQVSKEHIDYILRFARPADAQIDLVGVKKVQRAFLGKIRKQKIESAHLAPLKDAERELTRAGLKVNLELLPESKSVPETVVKYSETKKSWGILCPSAVDRSGSDLLLGSTSRKILTLTKRPFFAVRL